jgi:DNA repair protein RadC
LYARCGAGEKPEITSKAYLSLSGGSLKASSEDIALTQRIVDIFRPLDIKVLDHIIVGGYSFSSMAENGVLPSDRMDAANYEPIKLSAAEEEQVEYTSVDEEMEL